VINNIDTVKHLHHLACWPGRTAGCGWSRTP
jgi:hypothetical protein